jgi:hypothetical protein
MKVEITGWLFAQRLKGLRGDKISKFGVLNEFSFSQYFY